MSYIAGHYKAFWSYTAGGNPSGYTFINIGSTRNGFTLNTRTNQIPITDDASIDAEIDGIQSGIDLTIRLDYIEYDLITPILNLQAGNLTNVSAGGGGPVSPSGPYIDGNIYAYTNAGFSLSYLSGTLVLVAVKGTPAAIFDTVGSVQMCYAYPYTIITSDFNTLKSSKLRQGPATFKCLPDQSTAYGMIGQRVPIPAQCNNINPVGPNS